VNFLTRLSIGCRVAAADSVLSPTGGAEEVPDGAQEQRGESGEVPSGAQEAAQEEPGQQAPLKVWRQGNAGQSCVCVCVCPSVCIIRKVTLCVWQR